MPTAAKTVQPATMAETQTMTDTSETLDCFVLLRPKCPVQGPNKQNPPQHKSKSHSLFLTPTLSEEDRTTPSQMKREGTNWHKIPGSRRSIQKLFSPTTGINQGTFDSYGQKGP